MLDRETFAVVFLVFVLPPLVFFFLLVLPFLFVFFLLVVVFVVLVVVVVFLFGFLAYSFLLRLVENLRRCVVLFRCVVAYFFRYAVSPFFFDFFLTI